MTLREFFARLGLNVPEELAAMADYVIFVNGLPAFETLHVDHAAKVIYLEG